MFCSGAPFCDIDVKFVADFGNGQNIGASTNRKLEVLGKPTEVGRIFGTGGVFGPEHYRW